MTLREFYLQRQEAEFPVFMNVLKALPADQLGYKPNDRSPSAEQLVWTLAAELNSCLDLVKENKTEWKNIPPPPMQEMLEKFDRWSQELRDLVSKMDDASWERPAQFYFDGKMIWEQPVGGSLVHSLRCNPSSGATLRVSATNGRQGAGYLRSIGRHQVKRSQCCLVLEQIA